MSNVPIIDGLSDIADRYDVIFSDVWGVVHNGLAPHTAAGEALTAFRRQGGVVVMISNAPRPAWSVIEQLDQIGVLATAYDGVVTSGDVTRGLALAMPDRRCFHIGAARDEPLFRDLDVTRVGIADATFAICTGLADDETEQAMDYLPVLREMHRRQLPMICANPDLVVERGHRLIPCAGAIAALYEDMGGSVTQAGKPHPPIYAATSAKAEALSGRKLDKRRVLAVGDAMRTDVAGARDFGVDCLFLSAGIHAGELHDAEGALDRPRLTTFLADTPLRPMAAMRALAW